VEASLSLSLGRRSKRFGVWRVEQLIEISRSQHAKDGTRYMLLIGQPYRWASWKHNSRVKNGAKTA